MKGVFSRNVSSCECRTKASEGPLDPSSLKCSLSGAFPQQGAEWVDAAVVDFDSEQSLWVVLDKSKQEHRLPRLYVRFK